MRPKRHIPLEAEAFLERIHGSPRGQILELTCTKMSVGRTQGNDIALVSEHVSRCHAFFIKRREGWFVRDNGSKNGVLINGTPVKDELLQPGDIIQIGDHVFRFNHPRLKIESLPPRPFLVTPAPADLAAFSRTVQSYTAFFAKDSTRMPLYFGFVAVVLIGGFLYLSKLTPRRPEASRPVAQLKAAELEDKKSALPDPIPAVPTPSRPIAEHILPKPLSVKKAKAKVRTETKVVQASKEDSPAVLTASEVAKMDDAKALEVYLTEGREFLRRGDFTSAANAFQIALVLDPHNEVAMKGIKAAEYRNSDLNTVTTEDIPRVIKIKRPAEVKNRLRRQRRQEVDALFAQARQALQRHAYSQAIEAAEAIRAIEISSETAYLNEAKQIIDRARQGQKDEFEPFLLQAKEKFASGDYAASRDLCKEMLLRDPNYRDAMECVQKAEGKLGSATDVMRKRDGQ